MKKALRWFLMLSKRLYKKPTFVTLLLLLPILIFGYSAAAREDSGIVTIALAMEDSGDSLACGIVQELTAGSPLIRFISCETPERAETLVASGKADGAWIFPADTAGKISRFLTDRSPIVRVVQREENAILRLAREKLNGTIYRCCAQPLYLDYIRQNAPGLASLSDEHLLHYFDGILGNEVLFQFSTVGGKQQTAPASYLLSPLRGLLAVMIVLCGMAAAMYFIQDVQSGTFSRIPKSAMPALELGCQAAALLSVGAVSLGSLALCGLWEAWGREIAVMLLYCLCTAAFCMLLRRLCGSMALMAGLLPVLAAGLLVVCPVFFDIAGLRLLQYLFPPTYYIQAIYSDRYLLLMPLYALVCFLGCLPFPKR